MLKSIMVIVAFSLMGSVFAIDVDENERKPIEVILGIDQVVTLDFIPDTRVSVGSPSVVNYTLIPQKKEIVFKGVVAGRSSIDIRNTVGDIKAKFLVNVSSNDKAKVVAELKEFLGDVEGLEIGIKRGVVYVGGEIVVARDIGRVAFILQRHKDVLRLCELSPHTQEMIGKKMQDEIQRMVDKNITVRVVNRAFWLEGVTDKPEGEKIALGIAKAYMPDIFPNLAVRSGELQQDQAKEHLLSFITTNTKAKPSPIPKQVKVTSQFVELAKDYGKVFGMQWMPTLGGNGGQIQFGRSTEGGITTSSSGTLSGVIANLFPKLHSAKQAGYARIIQSGMVVTKDKGKGTIEKNTNVNFAIGGTENASKEEAKLGLSVEVEPQILQNEKVEIGISVGVSIAAGKSSSGTPLWVENKVNTRLIVKNKESAVVGGVVQNETQTAYDKDPPGGEATPEEGYSTLFKFLRSKSYTTNKSQYVVFVTPEILESASAETETIRRKFRNRRR